MGVRLYVSNLPLSATQESLAGRFGKFGTVLAVTLEGGATMSRRGAFVVMQSSADAERAISGLNLADFDGRLVSVYHALLSVPASRS
jgi:RNA recognition motif-containing protein